MSSADEETIDAHMISTSEDKPRDDNVTSEPSQSTPRSPDFPSESVDKHRREEPSNEPIKGSIAIERNNTNNSGRCNDRDRRHRTDRRDRGGERAHHTADDCSQCSKCRAKTKQIQNLEEKLKAMQMKYNDFGMSCRPHRLGGNANGNGNSHMNGNGNGNMEEWMNMIEQRIKRNHQDHERKLDALRREVRGGGGGGNGHRDDRNYRSDAQENDHQRGNR